MQRWIQLAGWDRELTLPPQRILYPSVQRMCGVGLSRQAFPGPTVWIRCSAPGHHVCLSWPGTIYHHHSSISGGPLDTEGQKHTPNPRLLMTTGHSLAPDTFP